MIIGVPKEIKIQEYRVAVIPSGVAELVKAGHKVLIEQGAGIGSAYTDQEYLYAGAQIVSADQAWSAQLVVKVKEPLSSEYKYLQGQIIFTFLHLAGVAKELTMRLLNTGTTAIAYETLEDAQGNLPLLAPMSAIAGNMAALVGVYYLARFNRGYGVQLGKVLGRRHGKALVIGDGVVGYHAARTLNAMGANVVQAGLKCARVGRQQAAGLEGVEYIYSEAETIAKQCSDADLVIGAVLKKGAKAPYVVTEQMIKSMRKGVVVVDVSIDQGGCIETSVPTSHENPVYIKHGVLHYCVTNMPGAYPRTSTLALCVESLAYVLQIAEAVPINCMQDGFSKAINVYQSKITNKQLATSLGLLGNYKPLAEMCV